MNKGIIIEYKPSHTLAGNLSLFQILPKELLQFIKGNRALSAAVIQIRMNRIRNDQEFLVVCIRVILHHGGISVTAEIAGVGLLPVHDQDRVSNLIAVL